MIKQILQKGWPHLVAVVVMALVTLTYLSPLMKGKTIYQSDYAHFKGMSKEIQDFREETGEEPLWTNSMFGGMPAYQISTLYPGNLTIYIHRLLTGWMPRHADLLFGCMLGFYILMCCLRVNPWIGLIGSIAFAFSSYFFIILQVGHLTKLRAIGYMAPVLGATILAYRGKFKLGGILMAIFMALEIRSSHVQITYYLFLLLGCVALAYLLKGALGKLFYGMLVKAGFKQFESKAQETYPLSRFVKASAVLVLASVLAVGANITNLWVTYEYGDYTTRGKSELTSDQDNKTSGLDKDYALAWSYGVGESWTLLIPNFKGGSSSEPLGNIDGALDGVDAQFKQNIAGMGAYFGDQPFTSGPVYAGAIVMFLFFLGMLLIDGPMKWGMLGGLILTLMLSWGKNFLGFSEFFLDYVPGYNKFRAVSMTLVVVELIIPVLAFLGLNTLYQQREKIAFKGWKLYLAFALSGGVALLVWMSPDSINNLESANDARIAQAIQQQMGDQASPQEVTGIINAYLGGLYQARENVLKADAQRSFFFILIAAGLVYMGWKTQKNWTIIIAGLGILILADMWVVNKRYLNDEHFVRKAKMDKPYQPTQADLQIMADKDPNFRVYNATVRFDQDGRTPYFHKSIGGYHGAKFKRFQELIDYHLSQRNMAVFNMLNTKYFIVPGQQGEMAQRNPNALGNAWFVQDLKMVPNADEEIAALGEGFNPAKQVIVDERFSQLTQGVEWNKSTGSIKLESYAPNKLVYKANADGKGFAVFSEIYYDKGWEATIDGQPVEHGRVNYVLRGMPIPAGEHEIVFTFHPKSYFIGEWISLISSLLIFGLLIYLLYNWYKGKPLDEPQTEPALA